MLSSGTLPLVPPAHPAFSTTPTFYMLPTTLIRRPDYMLSSPLGQHILDYEPPCGFIILAFTMFDGSADPYDHMLHYNQAMTLNTGNDRLLCKVFPTSLRGSALAWFHKLPLLNKFVQRTMYNVHITISLLNTTEEKHQLLINHSQT